MFGRNQTHCPKYENLAEKLSIINIKAGNSFNFNAQKIKCKYEGSADDKISSTVIRVKESYVRASPEILLI